LIEINEDFGSMKMSAVIMMTIAFVKDLKTRETFSKPNLSRVEEVLI
jgi:hypothetical protein